VKHHVLKKVASRVRQTSTFGGGMAGKAQMLKKKMKKRLVFLMCFLAPQIESVKTGSQSDPKSQK